MELYNGAEVPTETEVSHISTEDNRQTEEEATVDSRQRTSDSNTPTTSTTTITAPTPSNTLTSSALQLNKPAALSVEDPVKMMDSILKENGAISQNINLLGK